MDGRTIVVSSRKKKTMSFVDETRNVTVKAKVTKRNQQLNIKNSRLRKPLQNDNLLQNYFEWDKQAPSSSDLTVYKIVNPTLITTTIAGSALQNSIVEEQDSIGINNNNMNGEMNRSGCRRPSIDRVVTTTKLQVKSKQRPIIDQRQFSNINEHNEDGLNTNGLNSFTNQYSQVYGVFPISYNQETDRGNVAITNVADSNNNSLQQVNSLVYMNFVLAEALHIQQQVYNLQGDPSLIGNQLGLNRTSLEGNNSDGYTTIEEDSIEEDSESFLSSLSYLQ